MNGPLEVNIGAAVIIAGDKGIEPVDQGKVLTAKGISSQELETLRGEIKTALENGDLAGKIEELGVQVTIDGKRAAEEVRDERGDNQGTPAQSESRSLRSHRADREGMDRGDR